MAIEMEVRNGVIDGRHGAERIVLRCRHGSSTWTLLPGTDPAANGAARELLRVRHTIRNGCDCQSDPNPTANTTP